MEFEAIKDDNTLVLSIVSVIIGFLALALRLFWKNAKEFINQLIEKVDFFRVDIRVIYKSKDK